MGFEMTIRARSIAKVPSVIEGLAGIIVTKNNGIITISFDYETTEFDIRLLDSIDNVAPIASQPLAEAGLNNVARMTPLRTKQAIDYQVGPIIDAHVGTTSGTIAAGDDIRIDNSVRFDIDQTSRTALQKAQARLNIGADNNYSYATRALATASTIPAPIQAMIVAGYTAIGDCPPMTFVRIAAEPAHAGKLQSADGAWWVLSGTHFSPEQFGAAGSGVVNDSPAVSAWIEFLMQKGVIGVIFSGKSYRLDSALQNIDRKLHIQGSGMTSCGFVRNHNGTANRGVFHFVPGAGDATDPNGSTLRGFYCNMAAGTNTGGHISGLSSTGIAIGSLTFEDLYLTTFGSNTNDFVLNFNGTLKTTGAIGVRGVYLKNVYCFGANGYSCIFSGCEGIWWFGGGIYAAGGTNAVSGGIIISGTASVPSTGFVFHIQTCSYMNLSRLSASELHSAGIGAVSGVSIANDNTVTTTCVYGQPSGTVQSNWATSGIRRPGAAFATS